MGNKFYEEYIKFYEKTPKGKFIRQRSNAKKRGISWELTFEEWWKIWQDSGKWEQRGVGSSQFCMARINDEGPYAVNNIRIRTNRSNNKESFSHGLKLFQELKQGN